MLPRTILFLILTSALTAQEPRAQEIGYPLWSLRVDGNRDIPSEKILAASGLKIGETVVKDDFEAARKRLIDTGAFEMVGYGYSYSDAAGYDLLIHIVEAGPLIPYRFEDIGVPEAVLRAALHNQEPLFGDRIPPVAAVIDRYAKAIQQVTGQPVTGKFNSDEPEDIAIIFRPPTQRARVAEVHFEGNDALPSGLLLRTFSGAAIGIAYTEPAVRLTLDASIRPLYDARGRIRVSFPKIAIGPSPKVDGVVVTVTVNEGPVYTLGAVRLTGVASTETADLKKGDTANFDEINAALERIYKRYRATGYLHVTGNVERDVHDDSHTVDVTLNVQLGAQYRFGKLTIVGLNILSEPEIRKAWGPLEGKPYQPDYADAFLTRLRTEGVFDNLGNTRSEPKYNEESKTVDVTLYFSGADPKPDPRRK
jgi:outer membrane protein insertion porin family